MLSFLDRIFPPHVDSKKEYPFDREKMARVGEINRQALASVDNWIDEDAFSRSCFQYGVPDFIRDKINMPVGTDLTYTDLMVYLKDKHFPGFNYLEIGVSVGKNFFQMLNASSSGTFYAFDIEEINPVLSHKLSFAGKEEFPSPAKSIKKIPSSVSSYSYNGNDVKYISADVWDENAWKKMQGRKFNMVFSDALHTPAAILFEFEMLVKYDLLADNFIICWDDLVGKMVNSFYRIIKKYDKTYNLKDIYLMSINGWIGKNEAPHSVGMISNFPL
jgi:hypothetical protein